MMDGLGNLILYVPYYCGKRNGLKCSSPGQVLSSCPSTLHSAQLAKKPMRDRRLPCGDDEGLLMVVTDNVQINPLRLMLSLRSVCQASGEAMDTLNSYALA